MKNKCTLFIISVILTIASLSLPVFANNPVTVKQIQAPAQNITFEDMIDRFILHKDSLIVTGKNGANLTNTFISLINSSSQTGNYNSIKSFMNAQVDSVYYTEIDSISDTSTNSLMSASTTKYVQGSGTKLIQNSNGVMGYILMTVGGTIIYDRNSGEITSAYNPTVVNIDYADLAWWNMSPTNITASSRISSDKYVAYFTGSARSYGVHDNAPFTTYDFGTATITISGQGGD